MTVTEAIAKIEAYRSEQSLEQLANPVPEDYEDLAQGYLRGLEDAVRVIKGEAIPEDW